MEGERIKKMKIQKRKNDTAEDLDSGSCRKETKQGHETYGFNPAVFWSVVGMQWHVGDRGWIVILFDLDILFYLSYQSVCLQVQGLLPNILGEQSYAHMVGWPCGEVLGGPRWALCTKKLAYIRLLFPLGQGLLLSHAGRTDRLVSYWSICNFKVKG